MARPHLVSPRAAAILGTSVSRSPPAVQETSDHAGKERACRQPQHGIAGEQLDAVRGSEQVGVPSGHLLLGSRDPGKGQTVPLGRSGGGGRVLT